MREKLLIALVSLAAVYSLVSLRHTATDNLIKIGSTSFYATLATTPETQAKGLSGRASLPATNAMLFVFEKPGLQCFWMKDMQFDLDMLWFNDKKQLVHIEQSVSPSSYPKSYCPSEPSQYVIEVNAGTAKKNKWKLGDSFTF